MLRRLITIIQLKRTLYRLCLTKISSYLLAIVAAVMFVAIARADYVGTGSTQIFLDPNNPDIADGYQVGDEVSFILQQAAKLTSNGRYVGMGAWATFYVPPGVEVVGAEIVALDGNGGYVAVPARDMAAAPDGCGSRGCEGGYPDGRINEMQQDTGIFYSSDPQTDYVPGGYNDIETSGTKPSADQTLYNEWDYNQITAFGAKSNAYAGNGGKGTTPLYGSPGNYKGTGSPVAGPHTYYTNDFDPSCASGNNFTDDLACVGPWHRIQYPNDKIGGSGPVTEATSDGDHINTSVATNLGVVLDSNNPLPSNVNALRFAFGERVVGDVELARVTVRITDATVFSNGINNQYICMSGTGGDTADSGSGVKDNNWRYFESSNNSCFIGALDANLIKTITSVNGGSASSFVDNADIVGYQLSFQNMSGSSLTNIVISDEAEQHIDLVAASTSGCPYSSYNGTAGNSTVTFNSLSSSNATWNTVSSLAAGESITVFMCGRVDSNTAGDEVINRANVVYNGGSLTTTVLQTVSNKVSGTVYSDDDGSGHLTAGDAPLARRNGRALRRPRQRWLA